MVHGGSHFNKNDTVKLKGVTDEQLHEFMERFDLAIQGISSGGGFARK